MWQMQAWNTSAVVLQKGRSPFHNEKSEREGESERAGERQQAGFRQDTVVWGTPRLHWERTLPFWNTFGRRYISFSKTNGLLGSTEQLFNSRRQRRTQRTGNLVAAFRWAPP